MIDGRDCAVMDLETEFSADSLSTGWNDKKALGLSVGCFYSYGDNKIHWFDKYILEETVSGWIERNTFLVSFNGKKFDFVLCRAILRQKSEDAQRPELSYLCDAFKILCTTSYDILDEIVQADPASRFTKGINSLDAICQANGLGGKTGNGAQAPRDWQAGRIATVLNYCQNDVLLTKALFEQICRGEPIKRSDGSALMLPLPTQENANG